MRNVDEKLFGFVMGVFAGTKEYIAISKDSLDEAKVNGYFAGMIRAEAEHAISSWILNDMLDSWNSFLQENVDVAERAQTLNEIEEIITSPKIH